MEIRELRIGNYVRFYPKNDLIFTVKCLNETFAEIEYIDKDGTIYNSSVDYENLIPIPLTEEILLKFGYIGNEPVFSEKSTIFTFGIHKIWKPFNIFLDEYYRFEIKYVHQLQNLYFALTGEELTFK